MNVVSVFEEVKKVADSIKDDSVRRFPEAASVGDTFRQGDIYITLISSLPTDVEFSNNRQLAEGDTQGSRHIIDGDCNIYRKKSPTMLEGPYLQVKEAIITHPEHGHVSLPIGCYSITYQKNLDAEEREMRAMD